ncbi:class I SAM-dependent methyltransferase [Bacillus tianshenii]|uniref:class I SAM-dependent methyltransferase n=1 Tax=Sutcliffiella tianshenii TaxID=1463404 RepID=UPI001CD795BC|nr:class I SAM-dependent methyltransferase [Bacillus tianshenii]MCA1321145.1 class I SAM-dependent methyltransferase [Bacillus tianshenii]
MIVTTAGRTNEQMIQTARRVALELNLPYIERNKKSIELLQAQYKADVLVIGKDRIEWFVLGTDEPVFFHPNSAAFRAKRFLAGEVEPFIQATGLNEGMSFLDCTLGLASDSIIASLATGPAGKVTGIEANKQLAYIVNTGLQTWEMQNEETERSMRRIEVVHGNHLDILQTLPEDYYDVVYFDPMFEKQIEESTGILSLRNVARHDALSEKAVEEAKRVARKRVVLKDHWQSDRFDRLGFTRMVRKSSKFHYGYWEKKH